MSRPRTEPEGRVGTNIRFRPAIHQRLLQVADERDLSVNWLVNRAVERYLADLPPMPDGYPVVLNPADAPGLQVGDAAHGSDPFDPGLEH